MGDYTSKEIGEFLRAANRDLGSGNYTGNQVLADYAKTIIIAKQLQAEIEDLKELLHEHRICASRRKQLSIREAESVHSCFNRKEIT